MSFILYIEDVIIGIFDSSESLLNNKKVNKLIPDDMSLELIANQLDIVLDNKEYGFLASIMTEKGEILMLESVKIVDEVL